MAQRTAFGLVVERDTAVRSGWADALADATQIRVLRRARPAEVVDLIRPEAPLLALILGLSAQGERDHSMLDLIRRCRDLVPDCVILAVDHGNRPEGAAMALEAGADDALRGDHHASELAARLTLRLRASAHGGHGAPRLSRLGLTPVEEQILARLSAVPGEIVSRDELARQLGGGDWAYGDRRFDVHIARIRRKLAGAFGSRVSVRTIRARGYQLDGDPNL